MASAFARATQGAAKADAGRAQAQRATAARQQRDRNVLEMRRRSLQGSGARSMSGEYDAPSPVAEATPSGAANESTLNRVRAADARQRARFKAWKRTKAKDPTEAVTDYHCSRDSLVWLCTVATIPGQAPLKLAWDAWVCVIILYSVIIVPYRIGFHDDATDATLIFEYCVDVMFGIDIMVNFVSQINNEDGVAVTSRKGIAARYLRGWFLIDLLSTIPVDLFVSIFGDGTAAASFKLLRVLRLARLLKLVRLIKLGRLLDNMEELQDMLTLNPALVRLFKLLLEIMFLGHLLSCFWFYVATIDPVDESFVCEEHLWFECSGAVEGLWKPADKWTQYVTSMYWTIATITTVGYGDMGAGTTGERLYSMLAMLVGASVFGFIIGNISSLLGSMDARQAAYKHKMDEVKEYLRDRKFPVALSKRIKKYFEYYMDRRSIFDEAVILGELSNNLRSQVVMQSNHDTITRIHFLREQDKGFVTALMQRIKPMFVVAGELLMIEGDVGKEMYFLLRGTVEVSCRLGDGRSPSNTVGVYTEGHYLGEEALLSGTVRPYNATAVGHCDTFALAKEDLEMSIFHFPETRRGLEDAAQVKAAVLRFAKISMKAAHERFDQERVLLASTGALFGATPKKKNGLLGKFGSSSGISLPSPARAAKVKFGFGKSRASPAVAPAPHSKAVAVKGDATVVDIEAAPAPGEARAADDHPIPLVPGQIESSPSIEPGDSHGASHGSRDADSKLSPGGTHSVPAAGNTGAGGPLDHSDSDSSSDGDKDDATRVSKGDPMHTVGRQLDIQMSRELLGGAGASQTDLALEESIKRASQRGSRGLHRHQGGRGGAESQSSSQTRPPHIGISGASSRRLGRPHNAGSANAHHALPTKGAGHPDFSEVLMGSVREASKRPPLGVLKEFGSGEQVTRAAGTIDAEKMREEADLRSALMEHPTLMVEPFLFVNFELQQVETVPEDWLLPSTATLLRQVADPKGEKAESSLAAKMAAKKVAEQAKAKPKRKNYLSQLSGLKRSASTRVRQARERSGASPASESSISTTSVFAHRRRHMSAKPDTQEEEKPWHVVDPRARGKLTWDVGVAVLILYSVLTIPFRIGYEIDAEGIVLAFDYVVDVMFAVDMVVNFRTAFKQGYEDRWEYGTKKIAVYYLKHWFVVDLLSTVPIDGIVELVQGKDATSLRSLKLVRVLRLIRLLKLARLAKLNKFIAMLEDQFHVSPAALRLVKLFFEVMFIAHLMCCGFYFASTLAEPGQITWWSRLDMSKEQNLFEVYIVSIYYSYSTMTTVGYGDVHATNNPEMVYSIICMIAGATVFGYIVGSMASIVNRLNYGDSRYKEKMDEVAEYLRERNVSPDLRKKIRRYYEYYLARKSAFDETAIMSELSDSLKREAIMHLNKDIIRKIPFFEAQSDGFISFVMSIMSPMFCVPRDFIFQQGEIGLEMYFLVKGRVEVVQGSGEDEAILKELGEGSFFGEIAILCATKRTASIRAVTYCNLFVLLKDDLDLMILHYPTLASMMQTSIRKKMESMWTESAAQRKFMNRARMVGLGALAAKHSASGGARALGPGFAGVAGMAAARTAKVDAPAKSADDEALSTVADAHAADYFSDRTSKNRHATRGGGIALMAQSIAADMKPQSDEDVDTKRDANAGR